MRLIFVIIFYSIALAGVSQSSQNLKFEKSKGHWPFPVKSFSKYTVSPDNKLDRCQVGSTGITFFVDKVDSVKAVYEGKVIAVFSLIDGFAILTKFGDYFIAYSNVDNPTVKKDDYIFQGQYIGSIPTGADQLFVALYFKESKEINPYPWFSWPKEILSQD